MMRQFLTLWLDWMMSWMASLKLQASATCGWPMPGSAMLEVAAKRHWQCWSLDQSAAPAPEA
eukprot:9422164-Heterocapsa_arctica.AAC.1